MRDYNTGLIKRRITKDRVFGAFVVLFASLLFVPLLYILGFVLKNGLSVINWTFITSIPVMETEKIAGGIGNAIVGTIMLVFLSGIFAIPLGIAVGIFLSENKGQRFADILRTTVEILQGIPSIVIGIFAYGVTVTPFGKFSAFAGGVALSIMMLPVVVRSTEETLLLIPYSIKEAAHALGVPYYRIILKVVLPTGMSGIITGVLVAIARISGETAPLLFTAFGNPFMNWNIFKPVSSLPVLIYEYASSPYEVFHQIAWGAASILLIFIFLLNISAKLVSRK